MNAIVRSKKGMTFVELMCTITLASVIGAALVGVVTHSLTAWNSGMNKTNENDAVTLALQQISNEIRDGRSASITSGVLIVTFPKTLTDATTGEKVYDLSADDPITRRYYISNGNLVRRVGTNESIVRRGISTATFGASGGIVTMTLVGSITTGHDRCELTSRVTLRNYRN